MEWTNDERLAAIRQIARENKRSYQSTYRMWEALECIYLITTMDAVFLNANVNRLIAAGYQPPQE